MKTLKELLAGVQYSGEAGETGIINAVHFDSRKDRKSVV